MKPNGFISVKPNGFMHMQAIAFLLATAALGLTPQHWLAFGLAAALLVWWSILCSWYVHKRPTEKKKARGGRAFAVVMLAATLVPVALPLIFFREEDALWEHDHTALIVGLAAVSILWFAMLASSLFDWYYVYPRRDGLVGEPPCRAGRDWTGFTRIWYAHRAIAGIAGTLAAVTAATGFAVAAIQRTPLQDAGKIGTVLTAAATGFALTRLLYGNLSTLGRVISACCLSPPDIAVGDRLQGSESFLGGYVRDVALEGITVVRLDKHDKVLYGGRLKRHGAAEVIDKPDIEGRPFTPCRLGCQRINPNCQWRYAVSKQSRVDSSPDSTAPDQPS